MSREIVIQPGMHGVYLRGHFVGEIPEREWLKIKIAVRGNRQLWRAQARNLLRTASRTLGFAFVSVPLGLFWTAVFLGWLGRPVTFGSHVGELLTHPMLVLPGIVLAIAAMDAIGIRLGAVNYFAKARSALVKEYLEINDSGDVTVR
ncbi:MAG: hypothetical protein ACM3ZT_01425 [Bacillota bacterium]